MHEKLNDDDLKSMIERVKKELELIQKLKIKSLEKQIDLYLDDIILLNKELEKRKKK